MACFPYQIIINHIKNIEKEVGWVLLYNRDSIQYQNRTKPTNDIENIFTEIEIQCLTQQRMSLLS